MADKVTPEFVVMKSALPRLAQKCCIGDEVLGEL